MKEDKVDTYSHSMNDKQKSALDHQLPSHDSLSSQELAKENQHEKSIESDCSDMPNLKVNESFGDTESDSEKLLVQHMATVMESCDILDTSLPDLYGEDIDEQLLCNEMMLNSIDKNIIDGSTVVGENDCNGVIGNSDKILENNCLNSNVDIKNNAEEHINGVNAENLNYERDLIRDGDFNDAQDAMLAEHEVDTDTVEFFVDGKKVGTDENVITDEVEVCADKEELCADEEELCADEEELCADEEAGTPDEVMGCPEEEAGSPEEEAGSPEEEAGSPEEEAGSPEEEAGSPEEEAGSPEEEAGSPEEEAGSPEEEAGSPDEEAGSPEEEAGSPEEEAGSPDKEAGSLYKEVICADNELFVVNKNCSEDEKNKDEYDTCNSKNDFSDTENESTPENDLVEALDSQNDLCGETSVYKKLFNNSSISIETKKVSARNRDTENVIETINISVNDQKCSMNKPTVSEDKTSDALGESHIKLKIKNASSLHSDYEMADNGETVNPAGMDIDKTKDSFPLDSIGESISVSQCTGDARDVTHKRDDEKLAIIQRKMQSSVNESSIRESELSPKKVNRMYSHRHLLPFDVSVKLTKLPDNCHSPVRITSDLKTGKIGLVSSINNARFELPNSSSPIKYKSQNIDSYNSIGYNFSKSISITAATTNISHADPNVKPKRPRGRPPKKKNLMVNPLGRENNEESMSVSREGKEESMSFSCEGKEESMSFSCEGKEESMSVSREGKEESMSVSCEGKEESMSVLSSSVKRKLHQVDMNGMSLNETEKKTAFHDEMLNSDIAEESRSVIDDFSMKSIPQNESMNFDIREDDINSIEIDQSQVEAFAMNQSSDELPRSLFDEIPHFDSLAEKKLFLLNKRRELVNRKDKLDVKLLNLAKENEQLQIIKDAVDNGSMSFEELEKALENLKPVLLEQPMEMEQPLEMEQPMGMEQPMEVPQPSDVDESLDTDQFSDVEQPSNLDQLSDGDQPSNLNKPLDMEQPLEVNQPSNAKQLLELEQQLETTHFKGKINPSNIKGFISQTVVKNISKPWDFYILAQMEDYNSTIISKSIRGALKVNLTFTTKHFASGRKGRIRNPQINSIYDFVKRITSVRMRMNINCSPYTSPLKCTASSFRKQKTTTKSRSKTSTSVVNVVSTVKPIVDSLSNSNQSEHISADNLSATLNSERSYPEHENSDDDDDEETFISRMLEQRKLLDDQIRKAMEKPKTKFSPTKKHIAAPSASSRLQPVSPGPLMAPSMVAPGPQMSPKPKVTARPPKVTMRPPMISSGLSNAAPAESINPPTNVSMAKGEFITNAITVDNKKIPVSIYMTSCGKFLYQCTLCPYEINDKNAFKIHYWDHNSKSFDCLICHINTTSTEELIVHHLKHRNCSICDFSTLDFNQMVTHEVAHLTCSICDKTFSSISEVQLHIKSHIGEGAAQKLFSKQQQLYDCSSHHSCSECGMLSTSLSLLSEHRCIVNPDDFSVISSCKDCKFTTQNISEMYKHSQLHKKNLNNFKCPRQQCNFTANTKLNLEHHLAVHNAKKFSSKVMMMRCSLCNFQCDSVASLKKHMKSDHPAAIKERDVSGELAAKYLKTNGQSAAKRPKKTGSPSAKNGPPKKKLKVKGGNSQDSFLPKVEALAMKKEYQNYEETGKKCDHCPFISPSELDFTNHVQIHIPGLMTYNCNQCKFTSKKKQIFQIHIQSHTNRFKTNLKCEICDFTANHVKKLSTHYRFHGLKNSETEEKLMKLFAT